jgi:hypothetical protein
LKFVEQAVSFAVVSTCLARLCLSVRSSPSCAVVRGCVPAWSSGRELRSLICLIGVTACEFKPQMDGFAYAFAVALSGGF